MSAWPRLRAAYWEAIVPQLFGIATLTLLPLAGLWWLCPVVLIICAASLWIGDQSVQLRNRPLDPNRHPLPLPMWEYTYRTITCDTCGAAGWQGIDNRITWREETQQHDCPSS